MLPSTIALQIVNQLSPLNMHQEHQGMQTSTVQATVQLSPAWQTNHVINLEGCSAHDHLLNEINSLTASAVGAGGHVDNIMRSLTHDASIVLNEDDTVCQISVAVTEAVTWIKLTSTEQTPSMPPLPNDKP